MCMMDNEREMGILEARQQFSALVYDAAMRGTVTYVTNRGKRMAKLVPLDESDVAGEPVTIAQERNGS